MEGFLIRGWELILPGCGGASTLARGATLPRWLHEPQPISSQPLDAIGVSTPCGAVSTRGSSFSSPVFWSCIYMEGFLIRGWELILPGCDGASGLARGATLAARWLHEPQPISNQPMWLGFPHRAGLYRPGRSLFSSSGCWSCRDMEGFLIRG